MEDNNEEKIETEVNVMEFGMNEQEIDELIERLNSLKQNKTEIEFEIDDENELNIHYDEGEEQ